MAQQPSSKGKEVAQPPQEDDVEFPEQLLQPTTRLQSLNMQLGENSSFRNYTPTQNTSSSLGRTFITLPQRSNIVLGDSRRALAQRRRRLREQENASTIENVEIINMGLGEASSSRNFTPAQNSTTSLDTTSIMPQRSNTVLGDSRRALAQTRRRLREQENASTTSSIENAEIINRSRHFLGGMDKICEYCDALHWIDEKLVRSSISRPKFGTCCSEGKVKLPRLRDPPTLFRTLYDGTNNRSTTFLQNIRQYNATNAFTSLGCTIDRSVLIGRGPYSFTVHGELRHRTGTLLPQPGTNPRYAKLYIYDPMTTLDSRERQNPTLDRELLASIQKCLLENNQFVPVFRQAYEVLQEQNQDESTQNLPAYLRYDPRRDQRRYK